MKKSKTSHKGRKCKRHGCGNILSIYNHEKYCHIHLSEDAQSCGRSGRQAAGCLME